MTTLVDTIVRCAVDAIAFIGQLMGVTVFIGGFLYGVYKFVEEHTEDNYEEATQYEYRV